MEIIDSKQVFDEQFIIYLNNDKSNYLNKLLEFSMENEVDLQDTIVSSVNSLQTAILEDVISTETEEDYDTDIDDVRKEKIDDILYSINNYLMSLAPSDALMKIVNNNHKTLISEAKKYTEDLFIEIQNKLDYLKSISDIEYKNYKVYKESIDEISNFLQYKEGFSLIYTPMNSEVVNVDRKSPLTDVLECVENLTKEAQILNRFNSSARKYVSTMLNKVYTCDDEDMTVLNKNNAIANLCESILMNYSLLSIYSDQGSKVKISDLMLQTIMMEVNNGTVTKQDMIDSIENGSIRFTDDELKFVKDSFLKKIFYNEDKEVVEKQDLIKLVK